MKQSRFNFCYLREDGTYAIYNTYSKALIQLSQAEYAQLQAMCFTDSELEHALIENGILVDCDFDETGFLTYCHNATKFARKSLHLVLAITMDCNFGCPYCYENRRKGAMDTAVQEVIVQRIEERLQEGIREMDITWYGGEPLLHPDIIEHMSEKLRRLADQYACKLTMYLVSNGYLLTPKLVEMLDQIGIAKVQITLDGLKEHHDARRHLRNGAGTFEKIYENLRLFEEYPIRVDIRMNVDNENCGDFFGLREKIAALHNPNITLYPSPVEDINHDTVNEVSDFMTFEQFEQFAGGITKIGAPTSAATRVLDDRYCYCQAETESSYVIDELGYCYKCWDQVGRIENACFHILHPEEKEYRNLIKFMGWEPFQDEKCSSCVFLPICFGGCKFHRMNTGRYDCGFTEATMKRYLEDAFFACDLGNSDGDSLRHS